MTFIAAILYLPHHVMLLAGRAWYYIKGEHLGVAVSAREVAREMSTTALTEAAAATGLANGVLVDGIAMKNEL